MVINFFRTWYLVGGNVEKYVTDKQAADDNIIWPIHCVCMGKVRLQTHTYSRYYLLLFYGKNVYANAPHFFVYTYIACLVY